MVRNGVQINETAMAEFCQRHHIRRLALFGSVLRNDFQSQSDVDVLVEFEPNAGVGYIRLGEMENELSELIGRRVEMYTPEDLSNYFREEVLKKAETLYDAA
jgi:hypothetical protein